MWILNGFLTVLLYSRKGAVGRVVTYVPRVNLGTGALWGGGCCLPWRVKEGSRASAGELNCPSAKLGGQGPCGIGAELLWRSPVRMEGSRMPEKARRVRARSRADWWRNGHSTLRPLTPSAEGIYPGLRVKSTPQLWGKSLPSVSPEEVNLRSLNCKPPRK